MELREGAVIANRFRLVRLLGRGGMGEVWAARHTSLEIPCAVKFIHAESASHPEVRARFEREAKAAASLRSPNVVQILDYGIYENTPYIGMEYLEGEPLDARLKRRGRLEPLETYQIMRGVGRALGKAHAAGIVHRDLKPDNIFLVLDEDQEIPKVLDFGVAKQADKLDSNTQTGALLGTPYYMSPEQAQGTRAIDHRSDLWSLAVVAFRCMTGELPFKSQALGDLLIKIVTHPIPVPSHVVTTLPRSIDEWWARAAQRDPDLRYQTAKELVDGLAHALGVQPGTLRGATAPQPAPAPTTHSGAAPFTQSGASQLIPADQHPNPAATSGQHPSWQGHSTGSHPQAAPTAGGAVPGSTVAGLATSHTASSGGGSKGLVIGLALLGLLVVGGGGAFFMARGQGSAGAPAATDEPAADDASPAGEARAAREDGSPDEEAKEPRPREGTAGDDDGAASDEDETEAMDDAPPAPSAKPTAPPPPRLASPPPQPTSPRPVATELDVPKPTPKPKPQGFDPGF